MPPPPSAPAYPFVSWEVVPLCPGLVLLANPAQGPGLRHLADHLYRQCAAARAAAALGG
ncbi:MAG TPA: hypothetical protein VJU61_18225 [Polyangiaceae bacterium]|nr:hypothetical protein [Polyangiaceae bacterium]